MSEKLEIGLPIQPWTIPAEDNREKGKCNTCDTKLWISADQLNKTVYCPSCACMKI